mgnify:FL=1
MPAPNRSSMAAAEDSQMTQINHAVSVPDLIKDVTLAATRRSREIVKESVATPGTKACNSSLTGSVIWGTLGSCSCFWDELRRLGRPAGASLLKQGSRLKRHSYSGFVAARAGLQPLSNDYFATDPTL